MSRTNRRRVLGSGALWSLVYNVVWGIAWFTFMRTEWLEATSAIGRSSPWTADVWFLWVVLTVPIGVALMAYISSDRGGAPLIIKASVAMWVLMTLGLAGWGVQESLSTRVIAMDSGVNLVAIAAASLAGSWSLRSAGGAHARP